MATQYSNKPIVTNGLVYALDFGNQKSYVSGSTSAFNLLYSPITSSVTAVGGISLPTITNNLAQFVISGTATGSTINTGLTNHPVAYGGVFTVMYVGRDATNGGSNQYLLSAGGTATLPLIRFNSIEFDASIASRV